MQADPSAHNHDVHVTRLSAFRSACSKRLDARGFIAPVGTESFVTGVSLQRTSLMWGALSTYRRELLFS